MTKSPKHNRADISCIMPTFRRPEGLKIALDSLLAQTAQDKITEIIIADNDPKASAKTYVQAQAKTAKTKIVYLHVPSPGVSNARNAALDIAKGRYIAWLDDDQDASPHWIADLYDTAVRHKAGLVFSPTIARIPGQSPYNDYFERFFERKGPGITDGVIDHFYGCGNSLMDRELCDIPSPAFDPIANETGGEDDLLFSHIMKNGAIVAWRESATCYEDIRPHRATPQYVITRSFAFGQGPSELAADHKNVLGVAKWMLVGLAQMCVYYPLALIARMLKHKSYIKLIAKASSGAGKLFWFGGFKPKLYGQAVVANKAF